MPSTADLMNRALHLSAQPQDQTLELARCLADLHARDSRHLKAFLERSGIKRRKAYYLVNIGQQLAGIRGPKGRLKKIGWTKLQVIAGKITKENANDWQELAEENSTRELKRLVHGEEPEPTTHCVLMYFTPEQYREFEEAVLSFGG